ncbi:MAG: phage portal protein [Gemmatimonadota bacterium]
MITRLNLRPRTRAAAEYSDQVSPWDNRVAGMWSIVRGGEPQQYTKQGRSVREQGFESNPIVLRCLSIIADQVAGPRLQAYRTTATGDIELVPTSPLQQLLDQPANQLSGFAYRRLLAMQTALYGNAYTVIYRDGKSPTSRPVRLKSLHPERLQQVLIDVETDELVAYVWTDSAGRQHTTPWYNMIHVKDLVVEPDQWFGFPRGASALAAMSTDGEASKYVRQVITNFGAPGVVMLMHDGQYSREDLEAAEAKWNSRMSGRGERGNTRFTAGIRDVKVIGHTLKELEFPSLRGISREDICAAFGVDVRLVGAASAQGSESAMSGGQYQEARRKVQQLTCGPIQTAIVEAHDSTLTPSYGYTYVRTDPDAIGALLETPMEIAERAETMLKAGATFEEARRAMGLPEVMDPTHHTALLSLRTVAKAVELSETPPPALVPPDGGIPPKGEEEKDEEKRALPVPEIRQLPAAIVVTSRAIRGNVKLTKSQRATLWRAADARARAREPIFRDRAQALFAIELATVTQLVMEAADEGQDRSKSTRATPSFFDRASRAIASYYAPKGRARDAWELGFTPEISLAVNEAGSAMAADLGISFDLANPKVLDAIRGRVNKLSGQVAETTLRQLRVIIAAGREAGQDADQIARAIQAGVLDPSITAARAQLIAETETMGALNEGEWLAAIGSGVMQSKGWLDQADDDVRESHLQCGQQGWIPIEQRYGNGLLYPHDPEGEAAEVVRCRCSQLFSDLPADEAQLEQPLGDTA